MASQSCWKCLLRPSTGTSSPSSMRSLAPMATIISATTNPTSTAPSTTHPFSTSAPSRAAAGAYRTVKPKPGVHQRLGKRMSLVKKKKEVVRYRRPAQGERRAYRKRIVLSNNNAIPVRGLETMTTTNLVDPESAGKMLKIPDSLIDRLRTSEAFKSSQTWRLFHSPHMLVRSETVRLCRRMMESAGEGQTARVVIAGERAAGKSMLLLQATINAFLNKWVVINIPEAQELTSASTDYAPIPDTDPQMWIQSIYALKLMEKIRDANRAVLEKVYTSRSYEDLTNPVVEGATLITLIESAREAEQAWPVFNALWYELFVAKTDGGGTRRPPLLFAVDGLAGFMKTSDYRNPAFERIHSHDFAIVRMFVDVLSGKTPLPGGGAAIAATRRTDARNPSMDLAVARQLARQAGAEELPPRDPYCSKYDARVDEAMEDTGIEVVNVRGIGKAEARSLMEYWAASGMLRAQVDERTVSEKWMTGGNGIIGEMERAGLLTMRL